MILPPSIIRGRDFGQNWPCGTTLSAANARPRLNSPDLRLNFVSCMPVMEGGTPRLPRRGGALGAFSAIRTFMADILGEKWGESGRIYAENEGKNPPAGGLPARKFKRHALKRRCKDMKPLFTTPACGFLHILPLNRGGHRWG